MKTKFLFFVCFLTITGPASAACEAWKLKGHWQGTVHNAGGGIGACNIIIVNDKLRWDSSCTDEYGNEIKLRNSAAIRKSDSCGVEAEFTFNGIWHRAVLTMDRGVTVSQGIWGSQFGELGTISLVKK